MEETPEISIEEARARIREHYGCYDVEADCTPDRWRTIAAIRDPAVRRIAVHNMVRLFVLLRDPDELRAPEVLGRLIADPAWLSKRENLTRAKTAARAQELWEKRERILAAIQPSRTTLGKLWETFGGGYSPTLRQTIECDVESVARGVAGVHADAERSLFHPLLHPASVDVPEETLFQIEARTNQAHERFLGRFAELIRQYKIRGA